MKVLFIHSEQDPYSRDKPLEIMERVQFGISYISSLLKKEGHETRLVVLCRETGECIHDHIKDFEPGLICFTAVYTEFPFLAEVAASVKRTSPGIFLLVGGPHASLDPEGCLGSAFDAVCVGEGEYPTLELAEQLQSGSYPSGIPNLFIKRGGSIERNQPRPFIEDLDQLPFPDRSMWMPWVAKYPSRPSILVGRGCPFRCTYCCNHALSKLADGRYVRLRSPENIVEELRGIKEKMPTLCEVYLEVETMGANKEWALSLCSHLEEFNDGLDSPVAFGSNLRVTPNSDYEALFAAFAACNFTFINIGLESGSERIRREVLKRRYSNRDIITAVRTARRYGLKVGIYNLIGLPGETKNDFRETIKINRICQPDWFLLSVFFPYPGTELHDTCMEMGLLDGRLDPCLERRRPVLDLPGFSKTQVGIRRTWFPFLVYRGHRPMKELIWLVSMAKIYSEPRLIPIHRRFMNGTLFKRRGGVPQDGNGDGSAPGEDMDAVSSSAGDS
ncbi:MAG: radical SAM protein [Actinomycetota bacterium]|nr:radical SAM protein [Actinomycetota bacterium]